MLMIMIMIKNFSLTLKVVLVYSFKEAFLLGHGEMSTEHLVLGLIRKGKGKAIEIFSILHTPLQLIKKKIEIKDNFRDFNLENKICRIEMTQQVERILNTTFLEAKIFKYRIINTTHLVLSILRDKNDPITKILNTFKIFYDIFMQQINIQKNYKNPKIKGYFCLKDSSSDFYQKKIISTPVLNNYCRDLTLMALQGKIDQVLGREKEIERICQILSRMKKNNPLLIGEPGVGKTAIAEGLALCVVKRKVSRLLYQRKIFMLDITSLVAGTKFRGQFEERIKACMNELLKNKEIILFIDEIHMLIGAGGTHGSLDASNIFKPALAKGEIQCIGATTLDEYREYIERDGALSRRFQKIIIDPSSKEETIVILNRIKTQYEKFHNVIYSNKAIEACVNLTTRYIADRYLPDKAIDALDEAGSLVHLINIKGSNEIYLLEKKIKLVRETKYKMVNNNNYDEAVQLSKKEKKIEKEIVKANWKKTQKKNSKMVHEKNVAQVVSMMSGVPVGSIIKSEMKKLINMYELIKNRVIGQDEAVEKTIRAIQRNKTGLKDPSRPIGVFIFLGQPGVGKTQLAKIIAQELFNSEDALIRIDMSEYMEKNSVSRLIGAPPGYVGYEEGGQLTEAVLRKPYSVILLDELEKAHSDIFNLLLQVMDDGKITDSYGKRIDFRNTIIIFTSNIGTREFTEFGKGIGFETSYDKSQTKHYLNHSIKTRLKEVFSPEFMNRIDEFILFNNLKRRDICMILDLEVNKIINRMFELGYILHFSKEAKTFIADKGYDKNHGARPLKLALQKFVEDLISEKIIHDNICKGDSLYLKYYKKKNLISLYTLKKKIRFN